MSSANPGSEQMQVTTESVSATSHPKTLLSAQKKRKITQDPANATFQSLKDSKRGLSTLETQTDAQKTTQAITAKLEESEKKKQRAKSKPAYLQTLNESEKQANFKIIDNMNKKISFLKNPRFKVVKPPILMTEAIKAKPALELESIKTTSFRVEPAVLNFVDYQVNGVYEMQLKITNVAAVSKRIKFIPPTTDNFTIKSSKGPSKVTGDIAPGLSLNLQVVFHAPSFADFDDFITFVTEENSFKIPLRARREPPQISLTNPMDCLNSWLGDRVDMAFRCVNTGGDGGFKFFCEKDEDDQKQTDPDTIRIGSFTLTPSEFYLYQGSALDIYVSFNPEKEGRLEENLILACDNQTSEFYKLTGYGAMLDLNIIAVDGKQVNFKENKFDTLYFDNTNPTSETRRTITVKNSSPILVPFHWSVYKSKSQAKISLENEDTHYRIEPAQGKIAGGQSIDFTVFFCPQHAEPYFEFADLIVEDIPIASVRNPPEGLKNFAQMNQVKNSKVPMPTYVGSNTQFLSIAMIQFNLRGQGNSCKVEVEPAYCQIEGDKYINHQYSQEVKLKKVSEGQVKYKLRLEGKNNDSFDIDVLTQGKSLKAQEEGVISGVIAANQEYIDLKISVKSPQRGECMAFFYIQIEDGAPVSFQVVCNFIGPFVKFHQPVIDYGLVKVNSTVDFEVDIENLSPIPTEILLKNSSNRRLNFDNMLSSEQAQALMAMNNLTSQSSLVYDKPLLTRKGNQIEIDQHVLKLMPNEKKSVLVTMITNTPEKVEEYFEIMVKDGQSQFFQVISQVQQPMVTLNRLIVNLGKIYAGVPEHINMQSKHQKQVVVMKNYGNLPAHFRWQRYNDPERLVANFEPSSGVILPRSELKIKMDLTFFIGGNINDLFICDVEDMEMPLGFELHADAYGLNVSYETQDDQNIDNTQRSMKTTQNIGLSTKALQMMNFSNCQINKPSSQKFILKNLSGIKTTFEFDALRYAPESYVLPKDKNELAKEEAERRAKQEQMEEQDSPQKRKSKKKVGFATRSNTGIQASKKLVEEVKMKNKPIQSEEPEQTHGFSSEMSKAFTQTKQLEKEQNFYLKGDKGLAVVFSPHVGDLPPNSEVPITVTIYNNVCGKFDDRIIAKVKGLPDVEFPVSISITGSPVRVLPNQVGINYNTIPPTLPIPTVVARTKQVSKTFELKNSGIKAVEVDWRIFDQLSPSLQNSQASSTQQEERDYFDLDIVNNLAFDKRENPFKFLLKAIQPEPTIDSAFKIEPVNCCIGPRSTYRFTVTFDPMKGTGNFKSIILASPELSQTELKVQEMVTGKKQVHKKGSLGIISLYLEALTIDPVLQIDRKKKMDGQNHLKVRYWSLKDEEAPSNIHKLSFTNESKADLTFNLNINGPFQLVKTKTNSGAVHPLSVQQSTPSPLKELEQSKGKSLQASKVVQPKVETMFCLQPLKILDVHVKFLAPNPSDLTEWPMTILNERKGELVAYFNNGDIQNLFLDGELLRPKLTILTDFPSKNDYAQDELDFGIVNVERNRLTHIYLSNETVVTAKWMLNYVKFPKKQTIGHSTTTPWEIENLEKTDEPDVFEFSVTSGLLKGKSLPLRKVPEGLIVPPVGRSEEEKKYLPEKIVIKFKPKKNVLYKSKFRFTTEAGIACDLILKGRGSYEEQHD